MKEPIWLTTTHVLAFHTDQIREHGGLHSIRDHGLFESAIAKPQQVYHYNNKATLFDLAAAYAFGIVKNHPFLDGNKRTGIICAGVYLSLNGYFIDVEETEMVMTVLALASSQMTEAEFAHWLKKNSIAE